MLCAVLFEDDPDKASMRAQHMREHLSFLERHADVVLAAGPVNDGESGTAAGGLWLVQVESVEVAKSLVEADPLWPTGLRKAVRILEWRQVFAHGRCLVS